MLPHPIIKTMTPDTFAYTAGLPSVAERVSVSVLHRAAFIPQPYLQVPITLSTVEFTRRWSLYILPKRSSWKKQLVPAIYWLFKNANGASHQMSFKRQP